MSHGHGHGHGGEGASPESVKAGYELGDVRGRPLIIGTIAIFALIFFSYAVMAGLVFISGGNLSDTSYVLEETPQQLPPEPRIEGNPNVDGDRIVREAVEQLEGYGWVDQRRGTAHIPIERAMELLVEKGIDPFAEGQPQGVAPQP